MNAADRKSDPHPAVELRGVSQRYSKHIVLSGLDLAVAENEYLVVLGASGCGKSTMLKIIAGLIRPTTGSIWLKGRDITKLAPRRRDVSLLFQSDALYPHLAIRQSIEMAASVTGPPAADVAARIEDAAEMVGITDLLDRLPENLSGGERRRAALAKAIARRASVRLLDEPLSAVDAQLRFSIQDDLVRWHRRHPGTTIHVTHDGIEAMRMADRIAVIDGGHMVQIGTPTELSFQPATIAVARSLSTSPLNVIRFPTNSGNDTIQRNDLTMRLSTPEPVVATDDVGRETVIGFRASDCNWIDSDATCSAGLEITAPIDSLRTVDGTHFASLDGGGERFFAAVPDEMVSEVNRSHRDVGASFRWHVPADKVMCFSVASRPS